MKKRMLAASTILAAAILMGGCGQNEGAKTQQESTGQMMEAEAPKTQKENTSKDDASENAVAKENTTTVKEENSTSKLTEEEAKSIAFQDAGVEEANVTGIRIHQEYDDGREKYEIDFYIDNREYDYDIDSNTGEILSKDSEIEDDFENRDASKTQQTDGNVLSREKALEIVLARVKGAGEENVRMELEKDDGYWKYEGEILYNQREYEFELNGETGEVLEWSEEGMDD